MGKDVRRELRRHIANAIERSDDEPYSENEDVYLLNADAILAALSEHRDDVLDVLESPNDTEHSVRIAYSHGRGCAECEALWDTVRDAIRHTAGTQSEWEKPRGGPS